MKINASTVYVYLPAETSKWTKVDAFLSTFIYFLLFFSYTPIYLLLCNYPIFTKQPVLSAIMRFFHFFAPFFDLLLPFSRTMQFIQIPTILIPTHHKIPSRADARTPPTPAYFFYTHSRSNL